MPNPQLLLRNNTYYLRIRDDQKDRRISLKTCDYDHAYVILLFSRVMAKDMKINLDKIKNWTLEKDGQNFKMTTLDSDADRESAHKTLVDMMLALQPELAKEPTPAPVNIQAPASVSISKALAEYKVFLAKSATVQKSQTMALSTLNGLVLALGEDFDMSKINDEIIETKWLEPRLLKVAKTTCKRDLSFIRSFVNWASDKKRKYTPAPLALSLEAKGESWSYLDKQDLSLIFDNLDKHAKEPFQLWLPLLGLYTGARIAEISSIKTADVINKNGINAAHLRGTKTDASDRTIPLHDDILQLGFLDFVAARQKSKAEMLFDIHKSPQNGWGAVASKWYTAYRKKLALMIG